MARQREEQERWDRAADSLTGYGGAVTFVVAWNNDEKTGDGLDDDIRKRPLGDGAGVATLPLHHVFLTRTAAAIRTSVFCLVCRKTAFESPRLQTWRCAAGWSSGRATQAN